MTIYAGETVQIRVTGTDFDQATPLTDDELLGVYVTIFNNEAEVVLPQTAMTWSEDDSAWNYSWDTANEASGSYRAKIEAYGQAATPQSYSLEFARIRLARRIVGS